MHVLGGENLYVRVDVYFTGLFSAVLSINRENWTPRKITAIQYCNEGDHSTVASASAFGDGTTTCTEKDDQAWCYYPGKNKEEVTSECDACPIHWLHTYSTCSSIS